VHVVDGPLELLGGAFERVPELVDLIVQVVELRLEGHDLAHPDQADVFDGRAPREPPSFGGVADVMLEHLRLLVEWLGHEGAAVRLFRKHSAWYTKGFAGGASLRQRLMVAEGVAEVEEIVASVDTDLPFPPEATRLPRGKSGGTQRVVLPEGFLDDPEDDTPPCPEAESADSGG
jgi:hypothetical protein